MKCVFGSMLSIFRGSFDDDAPLAVSPYGRFLMFSTLSLKLESSYYRSGVNILCSGLFVFKPELHYDGYRFINGRERYSLCLHTWLTYMYYQLYYALHSSIPFTCSLNYTLYLALTTHVICCSFLHIQLMHQTECVFYSSNLAYLAGGGTMQYVHFCLF